MLVLIYVENIVGVVMVFGLMQMFCVCFDGYIIGVLIYDSVIIFFWGNMVFGYLFDNMILIVRIICEVDVVVVLKYFGFFSFDELIEVVRVNLNIVCVGVVFRGLGFFFVVCCLEKQVGVKFNVIIYSGFLVVEVEVLLFGELDVVILSLGDFSGVIELGDVKGVVELFFQQNLLFLFVLFISIFGYELEIGSFILLVVLKNMFELVIFELEFLFKEVFDSEEFQIWVVGVGVMLSWLGFSDVQSWIDEFQV